jgi:hypothetical protein
MELVKKRHGKRFALYQPRPLPNGLTSGPESPENSRNGVALVSIFLAREFDRGMVRLDSSTEIDVHNRIHLEIMLIIASRHSSSWYYWLYVLLSLHLSKTFPRSRINASVILEVHRHWPDPSNDPIITCTEVRLSLWSRNTLKASDYITAVHVIDSAILGRILRYEDDSTRDRPITLSLLADRASATQEPIGSSHTGPYALAILPTGQRDKVNING